MSTQEEDLDSHRDLDSLGKSLGVDAGDAPAVSVKREAPGLLRFLPKIIQEVWEKGATFQVDNATGDVLLDGFYKFGPLRLSLTSEGVVAHEAPDKKVPILSYSDLVDINYRYWCRVINRPKAGYIHPEQPWLESFRERNMVTRTVVYVPSTEGGE